jgi:hypothetical protein
MDEMRDERLSASDRQMHTHLPTMRGQGMMMEVGTEIVHVVAQYINARPIWQA